jgi:hypothetical protein
MPIKSRKSKRIFNQGKTKRTLKVNTKKTILGCKHCLLISMIKSLMSLNDLDWLFIKEEARFAL